MMALADEYRLLFETYEGFNGQSLIIKGWSVTVGMATLIGVYALAMKDRPGRPAVVLAALSVIPFWVTDALWKTIQTGYEIRLDKIERMMAAGISGPAYQSFTTWAAKAEPTITLWSVLANMVNATVLLPHALILFFGLTAAFLFPPRGPIETVQPDPIGTLQEKST